MQWVRQSNADIAHQEFKRSRSMGILSNVVDGLKQKWKWIQIWNLGASATVSNHHGISSFYLSEIHTIPSRHRWHYV